MANECNTEGDCVIPLGIIILAFPFLMAISIAIGPGPRPAMEIPEYKNGYDCGQAGMPATACPFGGDSISGAEREQFSDWKFGWQKGYKERLSSSKKD